MEQKQHLTFDNIDFFYNFAICYYYYYILKISYQFLLYLNLSEFVLVLFHRPYFCYKFDLPMTMYRD